MNAVLFIVCALVWGTTWRAIKYQLGPVDPMLSISYRFAAASAALLLYCLITKRRMKYSPKDHVFMALSGVFMFCLNYVCVYFAERDLPSGLVAVSMTTMIFLNALNNRIFLGAKLSSKTLLGGVVGIAGLSCIFYPEISSFSVTGVSGAALALSLLGALSASFGNTAAQVCQRREIPVVPLQAYAMLYGGLLTFLAAMVRRVPVTFDTTPGYVLSLLYLAVFGSVVAFMAYLTLLKNIGSDKAAYVTLMTPVVALSVSSIFEGYQWTGAALVGVALIVYGNRIALQKNRKRGLFNYIFRARE